MYVAMFGCDHYPAGYPFVSSKEAVNCSSASSLGWVGAFLLIIVVILGAFILPTVLIGIQFDQT
jgi:hypothetical protein